MASCGGINKEIAESTSNKQKFCQHSDSFVTRAVLAWAIERLDAGERVAIASVIKANGSVPGKPGARLAIGNRGSIFGTVGGAGLELQVEKKLNEMLETSGRTELAQKCFDFLPTRCALDLAGWQDTDIFAHS